MWGWGADELRGRAGSAGPKLQSLESAFRRRSLVEDRQRSADLAPKQSLAGWVGRHSPVSMANKNHIIF
jgi:hypothetical protein